MPGGDQTGPMGAGPMTGRGAGFCGGFAGPGFANRGGFCGRGRGRGRRNMYHATGLTGWQRAAAAVPNTAPPSSSPSKEDELELLKQQADSAAAALDAIRKRIDELQVKAQA